MCTCKLNCVPWLRTPWNWTVSKLTFFHAYILTLTDGWTTWDREVITRTCDWYYQLCLVRCGAAVVSQSMLRQYAVGGSHCIVQHAGYQQWSVEHCISSKQCTVLHADQCSELYCSNRLQTAIDFISLVFVPMSRSSLSCNVFRRCILSGWKRLFFCPAFRKKDTKIPCCKLLRKLRIKIWAYKIMR